MSYDGVSKPNLVALLKERDQLVVRQEALIQRQLKKLERASEQVVLWQHRALHDPLTGLLNRPAFYEQIETQLALLRRFISDSQVLAVILVDVDRFKEVNDTHGHAAGDDVLMAVAKRLTMDVFCRPVDKVARLGGDEFAAIGLIAANDVMSAMAAVLRIFYERLCRTMAQPIQSGQVAIRLGLSVGVSFAPFDGGNIVSLLAAADNALYQAKKEKEPEKCTMKFFGR